MNIDPSFEITRNGWAVHVGPAAARPHRSAPLWIYNSRGAGGWVKVPPAFCPDFVDAIVSGVPSFERRDNACHLLMRRDDGELRIDTTRPTRTESVTVDARVDRELRDRLRAMRAWW